MQVKWLVTEIRNQKARIALSEVENLIIYIKHIRSSYTAQLLSSLSCTLPAWVPRVSLSLRLFSVSFYL